MQDVRLTIKKRAFPSHGRVRFNAAILSDLGINEGEHVDLVNEATKKSVTATVIADTMVREGQIRVSEEDLKTLGLSDNDEVLVRRTPPLKEKIGKAADDAHKSLSKGAKTLNSTVRKTAGDVKTGAAKSADTVKKETLKASDKVGKIAANTAKEVKKTVNKATKPHDEL